MNVDITHAAHAHASILNKWNWIQADSQEKELIYSA